MNGTHRWILSAGAVALAAGSTTAQSAPTGDRAAFERRIGVRAAQPEGQARTEVRSRVNIVQKDDSGAYTLEIDGDEISASIDGEAVSADRIVRKDDRVKLLDEDGKVVVEFMLRGGAEQPGAHAWTTQGPGGEDGQRKFYTQAAPGEFSVRLMPQPGLAVAGDEPPPVMMGITMGQPSEEALEEYELEEGTTVLIDRVYDGLPAAKGGLKDRDILVEMDGNTPLNEEKVRKILREKKPGDTVKLKVLRDGQSKTIKVELAPYDGAALGGVSGAAPMAPQEVEGLYRWYGEAGPLEAQTSDHARKAIEEALRSLNHGGGDADAHREHARKALEEALRNMEAHRGTPRPFPGGQGRIFLGDQPGQVFVSPRAGGGNAELSAQLAELKAQLDEVRRSRDELKAQLDEIKSMLREMSRERERSER